jgi:hypothetical protein
MTMNTGKWARMARGRCDIAMPVVRRSSIVVTGLYLAEHPRFHHTALPKGAGAM